MKIKTTAPDNTLYVEAWSRTEEIGFLNMILEEYEGLVVMRTLDRNSGHLKFWVPESQLDLLKLVLDDFIQRGWMDRYEVREKWWEIADTY
ncbi:MAG: DUF4911 domain-containing protein [Candidatus Omnitrophica bacterium]|nr:DUF4911 domain-containing protein [Candidatus Omnitrophota bacterium]MCA9418022.1 DUF4911 domain-containing protein [Candidatus Omnitrophota bacterium]MCA9431295.1 DUF4911 domain-containing protein [Candidatus Omnitrophota bacterium]MCA9434408.1 DUF4911 domain-containing protein [Candidatus Omnitrophota bacterium]MCA9440702.1 DUF4911 domain-containing protein [Candidatus Omnitrophota bacterium]